ncbi:hypothetical protein DRQ18_03995 [bacterium]|nr:MAG: hypothetical protein DRQ18_03995 [bacterium]
MERIQKQLIDSIKNAILSLEKELEEAEAVGIMGSIARGDFNEKSDIDIFVIVKEMKPGSNTERLWWNRINRVLKEFKRDITVIVYTVKALKKISNWYVLRLASEGILIYDKGNIKELFAKIIRTAKEAGLVERKIGTHKVWSAPDLEPGERLILEVKD